MKNSYRKYDIEFKEQTFTSIEMRKNYLNKCFNDFLAQADFVDSEEYFNFMAYVVDQKIQEIKNPRIK